MTNAPQRRASGWTRTLGDQPLGSTRTIQRADAGSLIKRTVLPGGLRIITEQVPALRSVSMGVWVNVGSRDERANQHGAAHYLEHLLFKGTPSRTALDISAEIEAVGGDLNAFTTSEQTCYYARVLDEDLHVAVDVLSDVVTSALIRPTDVEAERTVILEEIAMRDDDPTDVVHESLMAQLYPGSKLGLPILGTEQSISQMSRNTVANFYHRRYRPENMAIAVVGNLEHRRVVELIQHAFDRAEALTNTDATPNPARTRLQTKAPKTQTGSIRVISKQIEQANVMIGLPGVARTDKRRYALSVLNTALGGGMSSRLFHEIRERRGLAYSVYSFLSQYSDAGLYGIYVGCQPSRVQQVVDIIRRELELVLSNGLSQEEFDRAVGQLRGAMVLGLEDSSSRMSRLGRAEVLDGELAGIDTILQRISRVTPEQVTQVAQEILDPTPTLAVAGPFRENKKFRI